MALYDNLGSRLAGSGHFTRLFLRSGTVSVLFACLTIAVDIGVIVAASAAATLIYVELTGISVDIARSRESALVISALFVTLCLGDGIYRIKTLALLSAPNLALKWVVSLGVFLVIAFLFKSGAYYSRGVILVLTPIGLVGLMSARYIVARIVREAVTSNYIPPMRLAVIGLDDQTEEAVRSRLASETAIEVATFVALGEDADGERLREVVALSQAGRIDQILVAFPWTQASLIERAVVALRRQALPVMLLPDLQSVAYISRPAQLGPLPVFELKRAALGPSDLLLKRTLDVCIATAALVLLAPLLAATAIAIKLDSPGPVLFRQRRHGFNNTEFRIFKFRSMRVTEDGPQIKQAVRGDPRITWIGRFLRKSSIDELPQLFNVIKGEMSLVGPRPHAIAHNEEWMMMVEGYAQRHNILPGITGLAQVNGFRGEAETPEKIDARVRLDLKYIESWSLALDIEILFRTVGVMFFQRQAY
jgi:putative colanic acid biosysnthesis UDP-glucose lipid carrier transferase